MMTETDYFNWLRLQIDDADFNTSRYMSLLSLLYHTEFRWSIENDKNRASDGIDLRRQYAEDICVDPLTIRSELNFPCTVLEMMVALSIRCENQIMEDMFVGKKIGRWFKAMIKSLGLYQDNDILFNQQYVEYILTSFLDREYERNGDGGLFRIDDPDVDLREMEIWYQMNLFLCSLVEEGHE